MSSADEMVLAGSRPTNTNPIETTHSRISTVLIFYSINLFLIPSLVVLSGPYNYLKYVPALFCLFVWSSYRNKSEWAYWMAPLAIASCLLIFWVSVLLFVPSILFILLMGWVTFSGIRMVRIHFHPVYKMGYSGHSVYNENINIAANEMLAACPTCLAVLAVNPLLLSYEDRCPHCDSPLVLGNEEE